MLHFTYCESASFSFIAQPVNTLSNLGFFLAAYLIWKQRDHYRLTASFECQMAVLICLIGVGSCLWHVTQADWGLWADMLPIFIFLMIYQFTFHTMMLGWSALASLTAVVALLATMGLASLVANDLFLQKSNSFIPVALWLLLAAQLLPQHKRRRAATCLNLAGACMLGAIAFRIFDIPGCGFIAFGTHWIWHLLAAATIYLAMQALRVTREVTIES